MTDLVTDPMTDEALHDAVESALRRRWPDSRLGSLETMHGGRSGVTLMAQVSGAPFGEVVVKAAPSGRAPIGRHDVLRQARVLTAAARAPGVVVPEVLATGTEPAGLATTVEGRLPITTLADELWLLTPRGNGAWRRRARFALGGDPPPGAG